MNDIESREDILLIMRKFYDKLLAYDSIIFLFSKLTRVD
jgi:hemoglobin